MRTLVLGSSYSVGAPSALTSEADKDFWYANEDRYKKLAALEHVESKQTIKKNTLSLPVLLDHHGVVFYEIENVIVQKRTD